MSLSADTTRYGAAAGLLGLLALSLALGAQLSSQSAVRTEVGEQTDSAPRPPNILLVVADDLGYDDTTVYNPASPARTPALQELAAGGIRFTRHYADSTCTPSRVSMLTGLYAERMGFRQTGLEIPPEITTLPEALRGLGYRTHLVGKWHAGEARAESLPLAQGFDTFFGFHNQWELSGEMAPSDRGLQRPTYRDPWLRDAGGLQQHTGHLTDILAERTLQIIESQQADDAPWFLYHGFFAPHAPIQPDARFSSAWPETHEGRYLALVSQMDAALGRMLDALERTGQADNTLVMFVSDNGGTNIERNNNYPWYGKKDETYEGSFRTPLLLRLPHGRAAGSTVNQVVMNTDLYPTLLEVAGAPAPAGLDGGSLLPVVVEGAPLAHPGRTWEKYLWNVDAMTYSYLSADGRWRLANIFGFPPELYDLDTHPEGDSNSAGGDSATVSRLLTEFRQASWQKSLLPVTASTPGESGATAYSGFDMTRTPYRHSFAIGLEIPPRAAGAAQPVLAQQEGVWRLSEDPAQGLSLELGKYRMRAAPLDRDRCNRVVLTGHFQPSAMYMKTRPGQVVKLYVNGHLEDFVRDAPYLPPATALSANPTLVYGGGRAVFSNLLLGDAADPYQPRVPLERQAFFAELREQGQLERTDIRSMLDVLCVAGGG